jgi:hypothetical protein
VNEVLFAAGGTMAFLWLVGFFFAPVSARGRQAELEALGISPAVFSGAIRIRISLNVFVTFVLGLTGVFAAPSLGIGPLLGGAIGLIVSIPAAYGVLAVANKIIAPGFNDTFLAVRTRAREQRARGAR